MRSCASLPSIPRTLAHVLATLAFIYADVEELDSATTLYGRAVEVARGAKLTDMAAQALIGLGQVAATRQDVQQAVLHFQQAIGLVERSPFVPVLLDARMELGTTLLYAQRLPEARAALEATRQLADSLNARLLAGKARLLLSEAMGDDDREAFRLLRETSAIASEIRSGALRKEVMLSYAARYARSGRTKEAFDLAMQAVHITDSMNWAFWQVGAQRQFQQPSRIEGPRHRRPYAPARTTGPRGRRTARAHRLPTEPHHRFHRRGGARPRARVRRVQGLPRETQSRRRARHRARKCCDRRNAPKPANARRPDSTSPM